MSCHYAFSSSPYAFCLATMPSAIPYILPLCLQFFPLCLLSCHYAFSSSPYALCLATMPSAMPYILPLCLLSCHYAFSSSPMPYVLPLCLQLCLISCHCALLVAGFYTRSHLRTLFMIIIWSCPYAFNKSWGELLYSCKAGHLFR